MRPISKQQGLTMEKNTHRSVFEIVSCKLPTSCLSGIQISSSDIYVEHTKRDCEIILTVD